MRFSRLSPAALILLLVTLVSCAGPAPVSEMKAGPKALARPRPGAPVEKPRPSPELEALKQKLAAPDVVLLDVRTPEEFYTSRLRGAQNIDFLRDDFEERMEKLDPRKHYYIYCSSGNRSGKALRLFRARNIRAQSLGAFDGLKEAGLPIEGISP